MLGALGRSGFAGPSCLVGDWAAGSVVITAEPRRVVSGVAASGAVADVPVVERDPGVVVGGAWFGRLGWSPTASSVAWHDWVLRRDHAGGWWFEGLDGHDTTVPARLQSLLDAAQDEVPSAPAGRLRDVEVDAPDGYLAAVAALQRDIAAGELYQANLCTRVRARVEGDAFGMWCRATAALRPRYGAWLPGLAAWSPELFLARVGRGVASEPIKGTRPRPEDPVAAERTAASLRGSAKERAEHIMIVDLVRNDLGRVCEVGSVRVTSLLGVEPAPGVWHLVSRVRGELRAEVDDAALLAATFPPGSVSGAPKHAALQEIAALEGWPRLAYTGAYGLVGPVCGVQLAVTIRSLELAGDGTAWLGVGGGVTAGSVPTAEWEECLLKAAPLLDACGASPH